MTEEDEIEEQEEEQEEDEDEEKTLKQFKALLEKADPEWGKKAKSKANRTQPSISQVSGLEQFLQGHLAELKAENTALREKAETYRDLLTPEQLAQARSPKKGEDGRSAAKTLPAKEKPKSRFI